MVIIHRRAVLSSIALWLAASGGPASASDHAPANLFTAPPSALVRIHLESGLPPYASADPKGRSVWLTVEAFYRKKDFRPAWISADRPSREATELLRRIQACRLQGLDPDEYGLEALAPLVGPGPGPAAEDPAALDVRLSYAFLKYASDLAEGRFNPRGASFYWAEKPRSADLLATLETALSSGQLARILAGLEPDHVPYEALKESLARHHAIAEAGGWPTLPPPLSLRRGARGPQVAALRARLAVTGDLQPAPADSPEASVFDRTLAEALKRFQTRHGLRADGVLDREALAALNVPVEARIRQIELSLERWRWLPRPLGSRYIVVNIPTFELVAFEGRAPVLAMRVVTGAPESPTPVFSERMTSIVFSPYWTVPPGIAANEVVPAVLRRPGYLSRNNMEVVRGSRVVSAARIDWSKPPSDVQIRQRPGADNSLGLVKFLLPNAYNVYLHDTPADSLFSRPWRARSHGCVRVEKPLELARYALSGMPEWTAQRIAHAMRAGRERHVRLAEPLPVYIVYATAWAAPDGSTHFRPDVYGHDQAHDRLLAAAASNAGKLAPTSGTAATAGP